jgi:hypothetical protein
VVSTFKKPSWSNHSQSVYRLAKMKKAMTKATMIAMAMPSGALDRLGGRWDVSVEVKKLLLARKGRLLPS